MNASIRWLLLPGILVTLLATAHFAPGQSSKPADIPTSADIKTSSDTLRDVYERDYVAAEKDAKGKKALAQKLFDTAAKRKTAAMVYACYDEARRLASAGGDWKLAVSAVTALNQRFPNLPRSLLPETLKQLDAAEVPVADAPPLAILAREEAVFALDREDYNSAVDLVSVAVVAAKKAEDPDLTLEMREYQTRLEALRKAIAILKTKPDDTAANTSLGTYWAFERKRWESGLRYLAKGADKLLA